MIEIIPLLSTGKIVEYHGKYHDYPPIQMTPAVTRPVPNLVGGVTDAAFRRAAKVDGWISAPHTFGDFDALLQRLARARDEVGRNEGPVTVVAHLLGNLDLDACSRLRDMGVTDILLHNWQDTAEWIPPAVRTKHLMEEVAHNLITKLS